MTSVTADVIDWPFPNKTIGCATANAYVHDLELETVC